MSLQEAEKGKFLSQDVENDAFSLHVPRLVWADCLWCRLE